MAVSRWSGSIDKGLARFSALAVPEEPGYLESFYFVLTKIPTGLVSRRGMGGRSKRASKLVPCREALWCFHAVTLGREINKTKSAAGCSYPG